MEFYCKKLYSKEKIAMIVSLHGLIDFGRVYFFPSKEEETAVDSENLFFAIFQLHWVAESVVSDRSPKFLSKFWKMIMELCGVKPKMSTSRHPQTDGAPEIGNRMIEN